MVGINPVLKGFIGVRRPPLRDSNVVDGVNNHLGSARSAWCGRIILEGGADVEGSLSEGESTAWKRLRIKGRRRDGAISGRLGMGVEHVSWLPVCADENLYVNPRKLLALCFKRPSVWCLGGVVSDVVREGSVGLAIHAADGDVSEVGNTGVLDKKGFSILWRGAEVILDANDVGTLFV